MKMIRVGIEPTTLYIRTLEHYHCATVASRNPGYLIHSNCRSMNLEVVSSAGIAELAGITEWLDHLTLVQRVPDSKPPSDLS